MAETNGSQSFPEAALKSQKDPIKDDRKSLDTVSAGRSIHEELGVPVTPELIYQCLEPDPTSKPGRSQLSRVNKTRLQKLFSDLLSMPPEVFDTRAISQANATTRSASESIGQRSKIFAKEPNLQEWVFLGRVGVEKDKLDSIARSMQKQLSGECSLVILFSDKPSWHVHKILTSKQSSKQAAILKNFFECDDSVFLDLSEFNPTFQKVFSDQDSGAIQGLFLDSEEIDYIMRTWLRKKNLILTGPPGVGKTFIAKSLADYMLSDSQEGAVEYIQFHQSYSYEDLIRGWRPESTGGFSLRDGVFVEFVNQAIAKPNDNFVFIIDELNRGNVSKIFGELLVLIESTKRSSKYSMTLAYRKFNEEKKFYVPKNLYILGMMNTADRSIAMVDYALRRRFAFYDIKPMFRSERFQSALIESGIEYEVVSTLVKRFTALNIIISSDRRNLGSGYEIGHSYFCESLPENGGSWDWYLAILESEIAPLLMEYWYDEPEVAKKYIAALKEPLSVEPTALEIDANRLGHDVFG